MSTRLQLVGGIAQPRHPRDVWAADLVQAAARLGVSFAGATAAGWPLLAYDSDNQAASAAYGELLAAIRIDSRAIERALFEAAMDDRMPQIISARELIFDNRQ